MPMPVRLPDWWDFPQACEHGHAWGTGPVLVGWRMCDCPPAVAASGGEYANAGHRVVYCNAEPGCRSVWYRLRHEPADDG